MATRQPPSPEQTELQWFRNHYRGEMRQLTVRAVATGACLGAVLSLTNVYIGLKSGWGFGVAITACVLSFALWKSLAKIGLTALPMDFIDASRIHLREFASMYWGLGARILRTARMVSATPNYFGLHLTNFGCGADSFIEHFYKHIMGSKASLILELDEHSAASGVMTRLEAYQNVIQNTLPKRLPAKLQPRAASGRGT